MPRLGVIPSVGAAGRDHAPRPPPKRMPRPRKRRQRAPGGCEAAGPAAALAVATQAAVAMILSPLLTGGKVFPA